MGVGVAPPPPPPRLIPVNKIIRVKEVTLNRGRRDGRIIFDIGRRTFLMLWNSWCGTPRSKALTPDELPQHLTDEEIARCLAAAITASATP